MALFRFNTSDSLEKLTIATITLITDFLAQLASFKIVACERTLFKYDLSYYIK